MRLIISGLIVCTATLTGCAVDTPPAGDIAADAALRAEIESLRNEIGKLEFRVFELEQALLTDLPEAPVIDDSVPDAAANPESDPPATTTPAGRYDLTPVE